jgi:hypothetical protein
VTAVAISSLLAVFSTRNGHQDVHFVKAMHCHVTKIVTRLGFNNACLDDPSSVQCCVKLYCVPMMRVRFAKAGRNKDVNNGRKFH